MSFQAIKDYIAQKKIICPECKKPIQKCDKYADTVDAVWDGFGDSRVDSRGSRITLICGNDKCAWQERTEFWNQYVIE